MEILLERRIMRAIEKFDAAICTYDPIGSRREAVAIYNSIMQKEAGFTTQVGSMYVATDGNNMYIYDGTDYKISNDAINEIRQMIDPASCGPEGNVYIESNGGWVYGRTDEAGDIHYLYVSDNGQVQEIEREALDQAFESGGITEDTLRINIVDSNRSVPDVTEGYREIQNVMDENFRTAWKKAERDVNSEMKLMWDSNDTVDRQIGSEYFRSYKDTRGYISYSYYDGTAYISDSQRGLRYRMTNAMMGETRRNLGRDADVIIGSEQGYLTGYKGINPQSGHEETRFFWTDKDGRREISTVKLLSLMSEMRWDEKFIKEHNFPTIQEIREKEKEKTEADKTSENDKDQMLKELGVYQVSEPQANSSVGAHSMDDWIKEISKSNDNGKRVLRHAIKIARETNDEINREVARQLGDRIAEMEMESEVKGRSVYRINNQEFSVERLPDGRYLYTTDKPEKDQELSRNQMREIMFREKKREFLDEQEKKTGRGKDLEIVPLNDKYMVIFRSADLESAKANALDDGERDFNFYIRDKNGKEVQVTGDQVKQVFTDYGIDTIDQLKSITSRTMHEASLKMKKLGASGLKLSKQMFRRAAEFGLMRQLSNGFNVGEDMAGIR